MREEIMQYKEKAKRSLAFVLAIIMLCVSVFGNFTGNVARAADTSVSSNVTFESLGNTLGVHSVSANITTSVATRVNLGEVSSQSIGFQCKVTNPLSVEPTDSKKTLRISLYNTKSTDPYAGGYLLELNYVSQTKIKWQVAHKNGTVSSLSGTISELSGEEIMVYAWLNGKDSAGCPQLNVVINDIQIATDYTPLDKGVEYVVQTGNYMCAANMWRENMVFKHVAAEIPSNVTFERLGNTLGVHSVSAQNKTRADLGKVSSQATGFQCRVTNPGSVEVTNDTKRLAIGLYNASSTNPWDAGYLLYLFHESENKISWEMRHRNGAVIGLSGTISDISGEEIMVYAWLNGVDSVGSPQLNVIINDIQIATDYTPLDANSTHVVTTGNYVSASNTLCDTVVFKHVAAEIPANVTFEDLGQTAGANKVTATATKSTSLGQVSDQTKGFKCWIPHPGRAESGGENRYTLGLYVNTYGDPWKGFTLRMLRVSDTAFKWQLVDGDTVLQSGQVNNVSDDELLLYTWLNGTNSEGQALLNVVINDILILKDATTSRATGTYMAIHNGFADEVLFKNAGTYLAIDSYRSAEGTHTAPIDKAPSEDVVFAGWYEDADYENPIPTTQTTGRAFAKWVPKSVLSVKYQIRKGTTLDSDFTDFRFVTTVDSLDYKEVGFVLEKEGAAQPAECMSKEVYKSLYANGIPVTAEAAFGEPSKYFMTVEILNMPQADFDLDFTITPTWTTLDGTTVAGVTRTINVAKQLSQM